MRWYLLLLLVAAATAAPAPEAKPDADPLTTIKVAVKDDDDLLYGNNLLGYNKMWRTMDFDNFNRYPLSRTWMGDNLLGSSYISRSYLPTTYSSSYLPYNKIIYRSMFKRDADDDDAEEPAQADQPLSRAGKKDESRQHQTKDDLRKKLDDPRHAREPEAFDAASHKPEEKKPLLEQAKDKLTGKATPDRHARQLDYHMLRVIPSFHQTKVFPSTVTSRIVSSPVVTTRKLVDFDDDDIDVDDVYRTKWINTSPVTYSRTYNPMFYSTSSIL